MTQLADSVHLFGSFEGLSVIDNEKQTAILLIKQASHIPQFE